MKATPINHSESWLDRQVKAFEFNRFALMAILITLQSCIGSLTAMLSLQHDNYVTLAIVAALTMGANSVFIAQAPAKTCLGFFYAGLLINFALIGFLLI